MQNQFETNLNQLILRVEKIKKEADIIKRSIEKKDHQTAYKRSYNVVPMTEKAANIARLLPTYTGSLNALPQISEMVVNAQGSYVKYTDEGWFLLHLPYLIPKKEKGDASFIRAIAYFSLSKYASENTISKYTKPVVLIYEHIYQKDTPEKQYRDHDNIEVNVITDLIALYCLIDDGPVKCKHFYTAKAGESDGTNVYVVPLCDFQNWMIKNI